MKQYILPITILLLTMTSCDSVRVAADYDRSVNFSSYKTFGFFKEGIDKAKVSDLDKRRILRAIESELLAKGFTKSKTPDLLVNIFTKEQQEVNVSTTTNGTLFIDLIDAKNKELVWQGVGEGYLSTRIDKKEERIKKFTSSILTKYPPEVND